MSEPASTTKLPFSSARRLVGLGLPLLAVAAVLAGCWLLYRLEAGRIADELRQRENSRVATLTELLRSEMRPGIEDVRNLGDGDALREYLMTGRESSLQTAIRRARFVSLNHPEYDQIRFIDEKGDEVLRVNQGGEVVAPDQLQNKARSPYFQQANTLAPGWVYLSDFDLTRENGKLLMPLKPVLRFAVPVFDTAGRRRGMYVISRLGTNLMARLDQVAGQYKDRLRVLDAGGNWLKTSDPAREWGGSLTDRQQFSLAHTNPTLWSLIQQDPGGQYGGNRELFSWRRLLPTSIVPLVGDHLKSGNPYLVVASEISPGEWAGLFAGLRQVMLVVSVGLALLTLVVVWLIRIRIGNVQKLRSMNLLLEDRVRDRTAALEKSYASLQERETLLEETGNLAKVGGWEFDPRSGAGTWTPSFSRIHDVEESRQPDFDLLKHFIGESHQRIVAAMNEAMRQGTPFELELEMISGRGTHKWVRTIGRPQIRDGRVVSVRGAVQDITEQKRTELRVQEQLQHLRLLERTTRAIGERQDLASILQVVVRTLEEQQPLDFCCVLLYDPTDQVLTVTAVGGASKELAGQLAMREQARIPIDENGLSRCVRGDLVYEEDLAGLAFPFPRRLASGGLRAMVAAPLQIENQVFGVLIAARRTPHSFSSDDCEFLRQLSEHVALAAHQAQLHDALKTAYDDLRNTQQTVMQQERLRVLGQMASGIAHDINNAISPIMLYTDALLEREPDLSAQARQSLQTIQQAVSDVAETVARMREFYRQRETPGELQPVQLNTLVMQLRDLTRARWETIPQQRGIVIEFTAELAERLPPVLGVENEIREALINLIFNAVDAMPTGGGILIRTLAGAHGQACVEVTDFGAGMNEETRRRCLEPFFTTKGEQGTGLGLAMVYGVMQRHGGSIDIDSTPGSGTTVRLTFAVAEATAARIAEPEDVVPTGLHVLLVDDDPILLRSLREILEMDGHQIVAADSGQGGINAFRLSMEPNGQHFSAVITDLGMPHVDGRAVAAAVKKASPGTPVILLTGWGERLLAQGRTIPHMDRVLSKPPRLRDLRKALRELVAARA